MNDDDIDRLVIRAASTTDVATSPSLSPVMAELREQIMQTDHHRESIDHTTESTLAPRRSVRPPRRLAPIAAVAAAAIVTVVALSIGTRDDASSAYAAEMVAVAQGAPRLLIDSDDWNVTWADELSVDQGEMTFTNGPVSANLHWRPVSTHADFLADRQADTDPLPPVAIEGIVATMFHYRGTETYTALWVRGTHSLELRTDGISEEAFRAVADDIITVDVDRWLGALPDSIIRPSDRGEIVSEMLEGLPIPDSFDVAALEGVEVSDRYALGARVSGAVACTWLDQWVEAHRGGDAVAESEAARALATSGSWPVLLDMDAEGDWPSSIWGYASAINGGEIELPEGAEVLTFGPELVAEGDYVQGLGCDQKR